MADTQDLFQLRVKLERDLAWDRNKVRRLFRLRCTVRLASMPLTGIAG